MNEILIIQLYWLIIVNWILIITHNLIHRFIMKFIYLSESRV